VATPLPPGDWSLDVDPPDEPADVLPLPPPPPPPAPPPALRPLQRVAPTVPPPPADRIVEAMLFAGGPPLTPAAVAEAIRGLTPDAVRALFDGLARQYRRQNRPYTVAPQGDGFVLALRADYRGVRERVVGGPRQARLTQPALDVLSLVAYRQPVGKADLDAARGADCGGVLRQLVRLGLVAVADRRYRTAPRFLELFHLTSLDDLPRPADG
jgi:segregation and condensation protein B